MFLVSDLQLEWGLYTCTAGIEFEAGWKGIRSGPSKSAYLKLLQPSSLPALLKCSMTSPLLMDLMLTILEHTAFEAPDCASEILQSLSKVWPSWCKLWKEIVVCVEPNFQYATLYVSCTSFIVILVKSVNCFIVFLSKLRHLWHRGLGLDIIYLLFKKSLLVVFAMTAANRGCRLLLSMSASKCAVDCSF